MQTGRHRVNEENDENLLQQVLSKYIPYWPLFVIAIIIAIALGYIYLRYTTPLYEATATIIIKDEKKGNEESKLVESLDQISAKKIVENEIEILQSRRVMENVVKSLGLYAPVYEKGDVHDVLAYTRFPLTIQALFPDSLRSNDHIDIKYDEKSRQVILDNSFYHPIDSFVNTKYGILEFVPNINFVPGTVSKSNRFYLNLANPKLVSSGFLEGLKAEPSSKLSSVVNLSYKDVSPLRAEKILDEVIMAYQQSANAEKDSLAKNTLTFVDEQLSMVARDLDSIEHRVQAYKSDNKAVDIDVQGRLYLQNASVNDQKLGDISTQLAVLDQVEKFVKEKKKNNGSIMPSTLGVMDPMLSQLITQLYNEELNYDKLGKTVGENNPSMLVIADKINKLKPNILENISSQRQSLNATRNNILSTNSTYNSLLQNMPVKERQLLDISRQQQIKSGLYEFLLQKKEESKLAYASAVGDSRVVDYALANPNPVSPKKMFIYLASILLLLGVSGAIIFIREYLNGRILYRKEIEKLTSIPILGEVAFDKSKEQIVIEKGKRSFIAEEFRKLRISLSFLGIDTAHKKILVTSSISNEGKSFISANLAVSLSLTGKKVVLVDMDLSNPTIHQILNLERGDGVTEFLEGRKDPEEIIKHVDAHENLFFISAGSALPDNPAELLSNDRSVDLINYLDNVFDIIVIDTSPMVLVTDGYLLTGLCDATLYVVRHNYTPKMILKRLDENNHINPIHNPAIIFNGVKMKGFFKNNYGYGYDYVYGNQDWKKVPVSKY